MNQTKNKKAEYKITDKPTDHCEPRREGAVPSILLLHYTETIGAQKAEDYFLGRIAHPSGGRVSVHYMIDEDGTITRYVPEEKRAWHAGRSWWDGVEDINSHSIGIELVNPGRKYGYRAFRPAQMTALLWLAGDICKRHNISPYLVLGHSDVAPVRKTDPGELFDWQLLATQGIGIWPQPETQDFEKGRVYLQDTKALKSAFIQAGYDPKADMDHLIMAFQRHYHPEAFHYSNVEGEMDLEGAARLHWLVRNRPQP